MKGLWTLVLLLALSGLALARGLDDAFLRIAEVDLPGFAAVYMDDDQHGFVVAVVPEKVKRPVNLIRFYNEPFGAELPLSQEEKRTLWNTILPRLQGATGHPLLTPDARVRFVVARYSYKQLREWVKRIGEHTLFMPGSDPRKIKPIAPCDFIYGYGYRDAENAIELAVRCSTLDPLELKSVEEDLRGKLEQIGIPKAAVRFFFSLDLPSDSPEGEEEEP